LKNLFDRGVRKRKKKLYRIASIMTRLGDNYIWRTKVNPRLKEALSRFGCLAEVVEK